MVGDSGGTWGRRTCSAGEKLMDAVDDAGAVEADDDAESPGDGGRLVPSIRAAIRAYVG